MFFQLIWVDHIMMSDEQAEAAVQKMRLRDDFVLSDEVAWIQAHRMIHRETSRVEPDEIVWRKLNMTSSKQPLKDSDAFRRATQMLDGTEPVVSDRKILRLQDKFKPVRRK